MVITQKNRNILSEVKQKVKSYCVCPYCKEKVEIGIEVNTLIDLNNDSYFPYPHVYLHGKPLHAMICYVDKHLSVRGVEIVKSIEISRDGDTFAELMKKWTNPY